MNRKPSEFALAAVALVCILILAACNCAPTLRYIVITPASTIILVGSTQQYTATGYYSNGSSTPGLSVTWGSSNSTVATINSTSGVATAAAIGTTSITATALGISAASATLNVSQLLSIAVTPANQSVVAGGTEQFEATGTYKNFDGTTSAGATGDLTAQVTWTATPTTLASFSSTTPGLLTAGSTLGHVTVTAALDGITGSTGLTIGAPVPQSIVINPSSPSLAISNSTLFTAQEMWSDGTLHTPSGTVVWTSGTPATGTIIANSTSTALAAALAPGTSTITATEGTLTAGTATLTVVTGSTHYAYVSNVIDATIGVYTVSAATSPYLTPDGTPVAAPANSALQTVLNPNGKYMYVIDQLSFVSVYKINGGIPSNSGQTPLKAGNADSNYGIVDPYGRFLYVVDSGATVTPVEPSTIYGFQISQTDGSLTPISGSPFTANLDGGQYLLIDRSGKYLYATNNGNNTVSAYQIDQTLTATGGALTPLTAGPTIGTGSSPEFAAMDPSGTHIYVADNGSGAVSSYSIGANGALTSLGPDTVVTGALSVLNVAVDPSGKYLYVLDAGNPSPTPPISGQLYGFTLTSGLPSTTPITGTPVATGVAPTGIAIDPTSALIAVDNSGISGPGTISLFTIGSGGTLTSDTPVATGQSPIFVTFYNAP